MFSPGIYELAGDPIAMQLIVTKELSKENNFWLQSLRNDLQPGGEIQTLIEKYEEKQDKAPYQAVMELIMRANWEKMEEKAMTYDAWEEMTLRKGEERGRREGEERMGQLAEKMIAADRFPDFSRAIRDRVFRQEMYEEFGIRKSV